MVPFPSPVFEGAEKRLELDLEYSNYNFVGNGLRGISREDWNRALEPANCTIVSCIFNECCNAYLLSESSLFVYDNKIILKTCGATKILEAVPNIENLVHSVSGNITRVKYSRSVFKFPNLQPAPHTCFGDEIVCLDKLFGHLGDGGHAYVLGDHIRNALWHVYTAGFMESHEQSKYSTLEVCMTGLDQEYCKNFFRKNGLDNAEEARNNSHISKILGAQDDVDDYVFDPCGYSLNAIYGGTVCTIHITPEEDFSYASVEVSGYPSDAYNIIKISAALFKPKRLYVATSCDSPAESLKELLSEDSHYPDGYQRLFYSSQHLVSHGDLCFHTLLPSEGIEAMKIGKPNSPRTVLEKGQETVCMDYSLSSKDSIRTVNEYMSENECLNIKCISAVKVHTIDSVSDVEKVARERITKLNLEENFYVCDVGNIYRRLKTWHKLLPRVKPFYAVKCNPDIGILSTLAAHGCGFDCASELELNLVLGQGVQPSDVVFANPCKRISDLNYMRRTGTSYTTFDSVSELQKIAKHHPNAKVLLRIKADDKKARCQLGNKYGALEEEIEMLLDKCIELDLNIKGVSFHVGSGASSAGVFREAIVSAKTVFETGRRMGITAMDTLDIGGGFSGGEGDGFKALYETSKVINSVLDEHFSDHDAYKIIAEPGRYFSEAAYTLFTCIYGKRERIDSDTGKGYKEYWLTDGLYGSMNCMLYDHATLSPEPVIMNNKNGDCMPKFTSTLFGPTCDGLDMIVDKMLLPPLDNGDWIKFPRMGAYTIAGASNFNGIMATEPTIYYVMSKSE